MKEMDLEVSCALCNGRGWHIYVENEEDRTPCYKCNGSGFVPTEAGVRILSLIRHNARLTVSAELDVSGAR